MSQTTNYKVQRHEDIISNFEEAIKDDPNDAESILEEILDDRSIESATKLELENMFADALADWAFWQDEGFITRNQMHV